ncbi:DoxX family membrane protein [soil metagenome]
MNQHSTNADAFPRRLATRNALKTPSRQAYELLHWGFTAAPVLFGIDKFFHLMTNWDAYLSPAFARLSPLGVHGTMVGVGVVELAAGLMVAVKPTIGGWVVAAWLFGIIVNLALLGNSWDIALRDFGLMLSAMALARLAQAHADGEV